MKEEHRQRMKQIVRARLPIDDHGAVLLGKPKCGERIDIDLFSIGTIRCLYRVHGQSDFTVFSKSADGQRQDSRRDPNPQLLSFERRPAVF